MRSKDYGLDVLADPAGRRPTPPVPVDVPAEPGLVVEDIAPDWVGAVVEMERDTVTLEDRHGRRRTFPLAAGAFRYEGRPATLVRPGRAAGPKVQRTASGSLAV